MELADPVSAQRIPRMTTGLGFLLLSTLILAATSEDMSVEEQDLNGNHPILSFFGKIKSALSLKTFSNFAKGNAAPPTLQRDTIQLAQDDGYGAERHSVPTEDGYILEVHRIYSTSEGQGDSIGTVTTKPVVVVHHDFLFDSRIFLLLGPGKALAYVLADAGYDVWLCNARGNTYSRMHRTRKSERKDFWNFSYTEHGEFDLPAVIDHAMKVSGQSGVHYIGHSMGATNFLIMGSKRPNYLAKVKSFTGLAPVMSVADGRSGTLKVIMSNYELLAKSFEMAEEYDIGSNNKWKKNAQNTVCSDSWYKESLCTSVIFALSGQTPNFDQSILPEMFLHFPSGSSVKAFRHIGQNYVNGFREYDYGADGNFVKYNSEVPPIFNISQINVPSQIYYGENDMTADPKGVHEICNTLPNVLLCEPVEDMTFGHIDFIGGTDVPFVYDRVVLGLRRIDGENPSNERQFFRQRLPNKRSFNHESDELRRTRVRL